MQQLRSPRYRSRQSASSETLVRLQYVILAARCNLKIAIIGARKTHGNAPACLHLHTHAPPSSTTLRSHFQLRSHQFTLSHQHRATPPFALRTKNTPLHTFTLSHQQCVRGEDACFVENTPLHTSTLLGVHT